MALMKACNMIHFARYVRCSTHWGRVTHICVSKLSTIGSDNGMSPGRRQATIQTNVRILLIGHLGTNFSEISIEIHTFSLKKMHFKISSEKWQPFCFDINVLICVFQVAPEALRQLYYCADESEVTLKDMGQLDQSLTTTKHTKRRFVCIFLEPLFIKRADVLPQELVKSRSREINIYTLPIALKFDKHLCSCAAEIPVKFQSDAVLIIFNLALSRLHETLR